MYCICSFWYVLISFPSIFLSFWALEPVGFFYYTGMMLVSPMELYA